jgi:hypothetical protein
MHTLRGGNSRYFPSPSGNAAHTAAPSSDPKRGCRGEHTRNRIGRDLRGDRILKCYWAPAVALGVTVSSFAFGTGIRVKKSQIINAASLAIRAKADANMGSAVVPGKPPGPGPRRTPGLFQRLARTGAKRAATAYAYRFRAAPALG